MRKKVLKVNDLYSKNGSEKCTKDKLDSLRYTKRQPRKSIAVASYANRFDASQVNERMINMTSLKNIKHFKYKKWVLLSIPIISTISFVTIITAAPLTLSKDSIPATAVVSSVAADKSEPQQTTATSSVPSTSKETAPATPKAVSSTPTKPKQTQPIKTTSPIHPSTSRSSSSTASSASPQSTRTNSVIATAKEYIGVPYVYGGTTPAGFDCSGFVQYVFAKNDINLPRVSRDQYKVGTSVSYNNLKPGDIVFFSLAKNGVVDHEGIYVGDNQFINAASSKGVTIYTLGPYWQSVYLGAKRVG